MPISTKIKEPAISKKGKFFAPLSFKKADGERGSAPKRARGTGQRPVGKAVPREQVAPEIYMCVF